MKHLKSYKIFESERFSERDITVVDYSEIENEFGISSYDIGLILTEFVEEYDLLYRCSIEEDFEEVVWDSNLSKPKYNLIGKEIVIYFYNPNGDYFWLSDVRSWVERKIGHGHIWDWEMLSEMESRLNDYGLTIKEDDIYQIFLNDQLQLIIKKSS